MELSDSDLALVAALADGLALVDRPYRALGHRVGLSEEAVIARITPAVSDLLAASPTVRVVLGNLEELEETPSKVALVTSGQTPASTLVLADQQQAIVNSALASMARHSSRIAVANFEGQLNSVCSAPTYTVGDVTLNTTTIGQDPHNLFLSDGEHIGTIEQGLLANVFITTIDTKFSVGLPTLTTAQILATAGLT